MPPTRPGRMSRLFVARLQGLEEALLLLRAQLKDGRFDRAVSGAPVLRTCCRLRANIPSPSRATTCRGLPTAEAPEHWHILLWLEHWETTGLIAVEHSRLLSSYVVRWSRPVPASGRACAPLAPLAAGGGEHASVLFPSSTSTGAAENAGLDFYGRDAPEEEPPAVRYVEHDEALARLRSQH